MLPGLNNMGRQGIEETGAPTDNLLTEAGDNLVTESGDNLVTE